MRTKHIAALAGIGLAMLLAASTAQAQNLVLNPSFQTPGTVDLVASLPGIPPLPSSSMSPPAQTNYTATDPNTLGSHAAALYWGIWTVVPGGRVMTRLEPSELYGPGSRMMHVWGQEIDQTFLGWHTGPQHVHFCALVKVVSGSVTGAVGDGGNSPASGDSATATGSWTRIGGDNVVSPANEFALVGIDPNTEFYIQNVQVSEEPIACDPHVDVLQVRPQTYVKPDPLPWTLHPEQGFRGKPSPSGDGAVGTERGSPKGFFNNMAPSTTRSNASGYFENMKPARGGQQPAAACPSNAIANSNDLARGSDGHETEHGQGGGKGDKASCAPAQNAMQPVQKFGPAQNQQ